LSAVKAYTRGLGVSANKGANAEVRDETPRDTVYLSTAFRNVEVAVRQSKNTGGPDVGKEMVDMASSGRAIQANVAVIRASDKTLGILLDTVA
jgi:flagellar basal body rod protein FlgG